MLHGLGGRHMDVTVRLFHPGGEERILAAFSGTVERISRFGGSRRRHECWAVWFEETATPTPSLFVLDSATFEDGEVTGTGLSLEDVMAEEEANGEAGTTWTITLRHFGVVTDVMVYV